MNEQQAARIKDGYRWKARGVIASWLLDRDAGTLGADIDAIEVLLERLGWPPFPPEVTPHHG